MAFITFLTLVFLLNFRTKLALGIELSKNHDSSNLKTYILHVKKPENKVFAETDNLETWYKSFLPAESRSLDEQPRIVYSYRNVMSGFAARLTEEEVRHIERKDGFVSARPEKTLKLQTTHTPNFLGLQQQFGLWKDSNFGKGVIVGVLDTGIFPDHPSFDDAGIPPPPAKWNGRCEFNASKCNNKLVGARSFDIAGKAAKGSNADEQPIDEDGHGTHTASTAAGGFVKYADALGNAKGIAVGVAPYAHLAIYKVCFGEDCPESDMLAGLDAAVEDGVDVLSLSIGGDSVPFFNDTIAVGAFAAIQKGIFVSCSAANAGPFNSTLSNEAPWILTVGASTIDRSIVSSVKLGNGYEYDGESLFQPNNFVPTLLPLVYAGQNGNETSALCGEGSLTNLNVKGKVVLCERGGGIARIAKGLEVKNAGGAAMILMNQKQDGFSTLADAHVLPASHVSYTDGLKIKFYINSTQNPTASILFKGTVIGNKQSPSVASFSSRGPSLASPGILKPDIIGPGVSVLAAWPFPLDNKTKDSKSYFNIISGTSMSCPHLSGIAALLKSSHPSWSPAAIKSALMTTAYVTNLDGKPIVDQALQPADIFAIGSGHVNPSKANDPGLIYDIQPADYIPYLCGLGYKDEEVGIIAHRPIKCSEELSIPDGQLNYPSFSVALGPSQTFTRTVTNVGEAFSSYSVVIEAPEGVYVGVSPSKLSFSEVNQKLKVAVTFRRISSVKARSEYVEGYLKWVSDKYVVRSPISVRFI